MENYIIEQVTSRTMLEKCFQIRREVFVKGQNVPEGCDLDGRDANAIHFIALLKQGNSTVPQGTLRIRHIAPQIVKLERAAVLPGARGKGIGTGLVKKSISYCRENGIKKIVLHSQLPAVPLYSKAGFNSSGSTFLEAGIKHILMQKLIK